MATVITLFNQKGGAGKSTIAICLAVEYRVRGSKVTLVDLDEQGSAAWWATQQAEDSERRVDVLTPKLNALPDLVSGSTADYLIMDVPGELGDTAFEALVVSSTVVVPTLPSPLDVRAVPPTLKLIATAKTANPDLKTVIVLNKVNKRTTVTQETKEAIRSIAANFGVVD